MPTSSPRTSARQACERAFIASAIGRDCVRDRTAPGLTSWRVCDMLLGMRKAEVLSILRSNAAAFRAMGVAHLALFGSVARDETNADSDIDFVIAGPPEPPITVLRMAQAQAALERLLGRKVDLIAAQGLDQAPEMRARIAADLTQAF